MPQSQLRITTQRLGQLQAKHDSQANITRIDIVTLIQRDNVPLAREKAEKLIHDESYGDVLEVVEMHIGTVLEHFQELELGLPPSPALVEAASTILYASSYVNTKDLDIVRNFLSQCLGPDFRRSAIGNREGYVSQRVLKALSKPVPTAFQLDYFLKELTNEHGMTWNPNPPPREFIANALSECLNSEASNEVDLQQLRRLCMRGLPDEPSWLRPRIWKLLFGIVSKNKSQWSSELSKQRDSYYDLVKRLLEPFTREKKEVDQADERLSDAYKELSGLPRDIFTLLEEEPEDFDQCPLDDKAAENIRISVSRALDLRIKETQDRAQDREPSPMPEIRLEADRDETPSISLSTFDSGLPEGSTTPKTLLASRTSVFGNAHPKHCSAVLRLLYLHNVLNPGNASSHTASLLIPLYSAMLQEVEVDNLAHVEADTFWLLEAVVAEFCELDEDGGKIWMDKLHQRVALVDSELVIDLESRGLDPALPHYSYRWLAPILTHTIPLPALFLIWDALFSRGARERGLNHKLEFLVDIGLSMLLRGKNHLQHIWKSGQTPGNLWTDNSEFTPSLKSQDGFLQSLSFLQTYDLNVVGGVERILQTAAEISNRRDQEFVAAQQPGIGARLNLWRGYQGSLTTESAAPTNKASSGVNRTTTSMPAKIASQLTTTVWRGITNQSAMDDDPSVPPSPEPERVSPPPEQITSPEPPTPPTLPETQSSSGIWGYADKLKDSDTLAKLSRASTNIRAAGLFSAWRSTNHSPITNRPNLPPTSPEYPASPPQRPSSADFVESPSLLSPPSSRFGETSPTQLSPDGLTGLGEKTKYFFTTRSASSEIPKVVSRGPKPLLLNRGSVIGHSPRHSLQSNGHTSRQGSQTSSAGAEEWAEVMNLKKQHFHKDSQSSVSSLSPSDFIGRGPRSGKSDWESDTGPSRVVLLNRRSISPMAPPYRRPSSGASSASSEAFSPPPVLVKSPLQESASIETILQSRPVVNTMTESEGTSDNTSQELQTPSRKSSWKSTTTIIPEEAMKPPAPTRNARVRTKRHHPRPANLQIQESAKGRAQTEQKTSPSNSLKVEWPGDEQENLITPKASSFDSDDNAEIPTRSPRRARKTSTGDPEKYRRPSTDNMTEERPRKLSNRSRKISSENRDNSRNRRVSAADDGDDEGYDELLSAYESEDFKGTM
ncbi:regulator of Vps4 activity in the MVB pathway-domain-containing protein [Crepidotus variabilis]|uniref:Regulator of Vps4 activity in the MVB pathway-domain-containing protein n=1 Tax=Crepidotus variabilis TaxID=179855 RepID=A0A9P6ENQ3_9AGAR|nr:regulator of Vps4 activity in the MVB pathway-domain-containing protein [Crepidotus variabilis]